MDIYLCCLDGFVAECLLQNPQVMRCTVELTCEAVADFMWSDACRRIQPEHPLHSLQFDRMTVIDEHGAGAPAADKSVVASHCPCLFSVNNIMLNLPCVKV